MWLAVGIKTLLTLLANKFDVQSALHMKVSLVAVNQIHVVHEAMNGCKNLKIYFKRLALKM